MKTVFFKIATPLIVILLILGNSFSSHASEEETSAPITCYASPLGGAPCSISTICSTVGTIICTVTYQGQVYQVFGKVNPTDVVCPIVCYKLD